MFWRVLFLLNVVQCVIAIWKPCDFKLYKRKTYVAGVISAIAVLACLIQFPTYVERSVFDGWKLIDQTAFEAQALIPITLLSGIGIFSSLYVRFSPKYQEGNFVTLHLLPGTYTFHKSLQSNYFPVHTEEVQGIITYNNMTIKMGSSFSCTGEEELTLLCLKEPNQEQYYCHQCNIVSKNGKVSPIRLLYKWTAILCLIAFVSIFFFGGIPDLSDTTSAEYQVVGTLLIGMIFGFVEYLVYDIKEMRMIATMSKWIGHIAIWACVYINILLMIGPNDFIRIYIQLLQ